MHLTSIEINGFKSFAGKTVLHFDGTAGDRYSITSIVGPNGSGKSNVSDAIRWVMGEQKMSKLRAKKAADLIFGGTEGKGQMSKASVTLTLDNSDRKAPIEFDELIISRDYYRTGESEYKINGKAVRLLDLQILLAKAQFGHGSYSVVGQGTIDKMLLQSPEQRKDFFDEASGIKEFQIKRHQAALKLHRTRENIDQAELLLNEVAPRLRSLSRQVKKLEQRHDVELALRESQEQYYSTLYEYNQTNIDELSGSLSTIEKQYQKRNAGLTTIQQELATLAREASRQDAFDALQREYQTILQEKNTVEREKAVLSGRMQTEYSKAGKHNVGWLENKIESLTSNQDDLANKLKKAQDDVQKKQDQLSADRKAADEASITRTELRGKIAALQQQMVQQKGEQSFFQFTGLKAVQAILEDRHKFGKVYGAVAQLGTVDERYHLAMDVAAASHISSIVVADEHVAQSCIQYLRSNQLGVATFLPVTKIKPRMVSRDIEELSQAKGVHGLASDLVQCDSKFADIFSYVFGNTLIVEDIEAAKYIGIGKARMVTLDGDVFERSGSMKGGYRRKRRTGLSFSQASSPHALAGNVEALEEEVEQLQKNLDRAEIESEKQRDAVQSLDAEVRVAVGSVGLLEQQKQSLDREIAALQQELSLHTMSPEEYDAAMKEVVMQKEQLENSIGSIDSKLEQVQKKMDQFNAEEEKKKQRVFALQEQMQQEQSELNTIVSEKNTKQIELAKFETKQEDLANEVYQDMQTTLESIIKRGAPTVDADKLEEVQVQIQKLKYKLSLIGGIDEEVVSEYEETKERHDGLTTQLDDLSRAMTDLEKLIAELDEIMKKKRAKAFKAIKREFARYFTILFEGGKADLVEIYGEDKPEKVENAEVGESDAETEEDVVAEKKKKTKGKKILKGIDVIANPPGKKIKHLQALSGGERTMTSIALVCAILHTNPSPFVVLDEVEAALDEANSVRLTQILKELATASQFVLITHNRATMHASDALYGVTMGNDGISKLVSVKLGEAEKAV